MKRCRVPVILVSLVLASVMAAWGVEKSSLVTIEGRVASVATHPGEGELELIEVRLSLDDHPDRTVGILLGPEAAMEEIGFAVEEGDRLRAKIFSEDEEPARVHKALNLSRDTMVRFRTLRRVPLWDGNGVWQGGPGRGPGAQGHRGQGHGSGRQTGRGGQGGGPR